MTSSHSNGLVGLRVIATLLVAIFHFELYYPIANIKIFNGSYLCVEFFFILSGFLFSKKYFRSTKIYSFKNFITNRILRLYPAYFFSLLILPTIYAVTWFKGNYWAWLKDGTHLPAFLSELFMLQVTGIANFEFINWPAWYVSALILCSSLLFLIRRININPYLCIGVSLFLYGIMIAYKCPEMSPAPYGLIRGMAGMTFGIFLEHVHLIYKEKIEYYDTKILNIIEIAAFIFFMRMLLIRSDAIYNIFILIPISFLIISMFSQNKSILSKILGSKYFLYLESISYQFYIVQSFCSNIFTCILTNVTGVTAYIYYITLNFVVAVFIYEVFEKKFISWIRTGYQKKYTL